MQNHKNKRLKKLYKWLLGSIAFGLFYSGHNGPEFDKVPMYAIYNPKNIKSDLFFAHLSRTNDTADWVYIHDRDTINLTQNINSRIEYSKQKPIKLDTLTSVIDTCYINAWPPLCLGYYDNRLRTTHAIHFLADTNMPDYKQTQFQRRLDLVNNRHFINTAHERHHDHNQYEYPYKKGIKKLDVSDKVLAEYHNEISATIRSYFAVRKKFTSGINIDYSDADKYQRYISFLKSNYKSVSKIPDSNEIIFIFKNILTADWIDAYTNKNSAGKRCRNNILTMSPDMKNTRKILNNMIKHYYTYDCFTDGELCLLDIIGPDYINDNINSILLNNAEISKLIVDIQEIRKNGETAENKLFKIQRDYGYNKMNQLIQIWTRAAKQKPR